MAMAAPSMAFCAPISMVRVFTRAGGWRSPRPSADPMASASTLSVIAAAPPANGSPVTMIGHGRNRGAATTFDGTPGWEWGSGHAMRWGTNEVDRLETVLGTEAIAVIFDESGLTHESQGVVGDSGGAMFHDTGSGWELVGILFARGEFGGQPGETSIFGNESYAADLSVYRAQILATKNVPSCSDGLDDDQDGLTDFPADLGCDSPDDPSERPSHLVPAIGGGEMCA